VADWCRFNGTGTVFIDPGSPWQNTRIESFNGRLRDEFFKRHRFDSLLEAQVLIEGWRLQHQPSPQRTRLVQPQRVLPRPGPSDTNANSQKGLN
jgi:transposase InsO family protein